MTIRTKPAQKDKPAGRQMPDPGRRRRARGRSDARKALDRTMGRLEARPADLVASTHAGWAELPLLLDGDFDRDDDEGAVTLAQRLHRAIRDEEGGWDLS